MDKKNGEHNAPHFYLLHTGRSLEIVQPSIENGQFLFLQDFVLDQSAVTPKQILRQILRSALQIDIRQQLYDLLIIQITADLILEILDETVFIPVLIDR